MPTNLDQYFQGMGQRSEAMDIKEPNPPSAYSPQQNPSQPQAQPIELSYGKHSSVPTAITTPCHGHNLYTYN
jgi:hypothetical protein